MNFPFTLRSKAAFDVVGFGTNAVDFLIEVPSYPAFNSKIELTDYAQAPGGEVASTMAGLQRLGLKTSYIGRFGDDDAGEVGLSSLVREGVNIDLAEKVPNARTQIAFIVIDERNGERTVIWKRDSKLGYKADEVPLSAVRDTKVLHLTPHDTEACIKLAGEARQNGVIVSIDIDRAFDGIDQLLPLVDILIASADLPNALTGIADHSRSLTTLKDKFGCGIAGITLGDKGSLVLGPEGFIESSAYPVPNGCRDTTGAGDAFRVGMIYGLVTGRTIEESCRFANAAASLKCRALGARTSLPTLTELQDLVDAAALA